MGVLWQGGVGCRGLQAMSAVVYALHARSSRAIIGGIQERLCVVIYIVESRP